jgi:hypothetical protein
MVTPFMKNAIYGNVIYGNAIYGNAIYGNAIYGNAIYGNAIYGNDAPPGPRGPLLRIHSRQVSASTEIGRSTAGPLYPCQAYACG